MSSMESLFDPGGEDPAKENAPLPLWLALKPDALPAPPDEESCRALWDKYAMPAHIRDHSRMVASVAWQTAFLLKKSGANICLPSVLASGLLHDLGKIYSITHGGSHAQLGAAWAMRETRNGRVSQGVFHHVHWPWTLDVHNDAILLPLVIIYADKRAMHDRLVPLAERYEDLKKRYGRTPESIRKIGLAMRQGLDLEAAISRRTGVNLHEHSFDCGRLVQ